ncbi:MAG: hypothetical protein OEV37_01820 [Candidatus Berkelbacteria bacterium]|nr:hypothetical protein [Candidatus Berkelbacteria bacterium]
MAEEFVDARKESGAKKISPIKITIIVLAVIAVGALGFIGYSFAKSKYGWGKSDASPTPTVSAVPSPSPTPSVVMVVDEGVAWIKPPEKLDDLGLFSKKEGFEGMGEYQSTDYYKVATTTEGSEIITAVVNVAVPGVGEDIHRFVKRGGTYYRIAQNSFNENGDMYNWGGFQQEQNYVLKSLLNEKVISQGKTDLTHSFLGGIEAAEGFSSGGKLMSTKWGELKLELGQSVDESDGLAKVGRYYIELNDSTKAYYQPRPSFARDDNTFALDWIKDGSGKNFEMMRVSGCGGAFGAFPVVVTKSALNNKVLAGTKGDSKFYTFENVADDIVKFGYKVYEMDGLGGKDDISTFASNFGINLWVDDLKTDVIYSNVKYLPQVECAKPVVYLYPQKEMPVKVLVGANISQSDPPYGEGWNVVAKPSGQIISAGKVYPYLFWDGLGLGMYPAIKSGAVVESSKVKSTITGQLKEIGLNQKEITDFLEFWMPKMPSSPYVRLTWFTNEELAELAPLKVTPKPDSVIRVFLDFAALDKSVALPPQVLPKYERKGFTVVEWGGLLRSSR